MPVESFGMTSSPSTFKVDIHHSRNSSSPGTGDKDYVDRDQQEMARLGKKQELRRNFGFMSMLGFSCTLMITWEGLFTVFVYGLTDGGPAGLVYGYLFCWVGYLTVVASLAEMVSMAPTAGGQYHWVYLLADKRYRKFLSFITGWGTLLSWQACLASAAYLGGTIIQGLLVMNQPHYKFHRWQGTLLLFAVVLVAMLFNTYLAKQLPRVEGLVLILHITGFFGILITITYLAPHGTTSDVFVKYLALGGYDKGTSFFVGLITTVFAFIGADGAIHMSEEIKNASTVVPHSLIAAIVLNGAMGFGMLLAILFCIGNIPKALASRTGFPFMEIFLQACGSTGGATALVSIVLSMMVSACLAVLAATSRVMWAFARDNGVPGSRWISRVDPKSKLPLYAIAVSVVITMLLGLLNIGSAAAFDAVASLVVSGYFFSYIPPIAVLLHKRLCRPHAVYYGPFKLGVLGVPCNIIAICWMLVVMIFSFFPANRTDLTLVTMNWSCVLLVGVLTIGVVYYFSYARGRFHGPICDADSSDQMCV